METEDCEWRPVIGRLGSYEVSNTGLVRSLDRWIEQHDGIRRYLRGVVLKASPNSSGYPTVSLWRNNRSVVRRVHTLVAEAFIGPRPSSNHECCHWDGNPSNNHVANLRWDTPSGNAYDRVRHGTHQWANKTHCPAGHPYDGERIRFATKKDGGKERVCNICHTEATTRYYLKNRPDECSEGHPFSGENLHVYERNGYEVRMCKTCALAREEAKRGPSCVNGHPFVPANRYYKKDGCSSCIPCMRARTRARRARQKALSVAN